MTIKLEGSLQFLVDGNDSVLVTVNLNEYREKYTCEIIMSL
jgi:hypothetical protein